MRMDCECSKEVYKNNKIPVPFAILSSPCILSNDSIYSLKSMISTFRFPLSVLLVEEARILKLFITLC